MNSFVVILLTLVAASASMRLGYKRGQRYTYNYQTDVTHAVRIGSTKTLGLRVKCQAHLDVYTRKSMTVIQFRLDKIQVHQVTGSLGEHKQQQEKALNEKVEAVIKDRLRKPVNVVLKDDLCIKQVFADDKDEEWSLNIKRGLVNLFQICPRQDDQGDRGFVTQLETTAVGHCQVSYAIERDKSQSGLEGDAQQFTKVTKVINYEKCQNRPEFRQYTFNMEKCEQCQQSTGYAPYHRTAGQIEHTLTGSAKAGYVIKRTQAVEEHVVTTYSRSDDQVIVRTRQFLEHQEGPPKKAGKVERLPKKTSHRLVVENPEKQARQNAQWQEEVAKQVATTVSEMGAAIQQRSGHQAAEKFANLVVQLRQCNEGTLRKLADMMLALQGQTERKFCIDALSYAGTAEAAKVLMEKFKEGKLHRPDDLKRVFLGLASASRPTADHITNTWDLCNHPNVAKDTSCRRQCMLTFGALVYKIKQRPSLQQDTKAKAACKQYIEEIKKRLASGRTKADEKLMYIQALGNAASTEARETLQGILENRQQDLRIRVECVWALRRILPAARQKTTRRLITVFADARESPELRMAIFSLLLNSGPTFTTLQVVTNLVKREITSSTPGPRSNQVASFVISHLSALAYSNNVLTKRRSMQACRILRLMPRMNYGLGYSKGIRFAHHSEKFQTGFEVEANKMNVPDSMLPRNMNARIQLNMMGYKMNALEVGARIENMDLFIDQVASEVRKRHKRSLWGNMLLWLNEESSDDDEEEIKKPTKRPSQRPTKATRRLAARIKRPQPTSRPASLQPTASQRPSTQQDPSFPDSDGHKSPRRMSAYMKLFGDEVKYIEITQESITKFEQDIADLLMGTKAKIEYADAGIVITKKGVQFTQILEKAFQLVNARRLVHTLAGVPLDFQYRSAAVVKATAKANINVEPSIATLLLFQKLTGNAEISPNFGAHEHQQIGIHTPYLSMGLRVKGAVQANPHHSFDMTFQAGKEYDFNYNLPQEQRDIIRIKWDADAFVQQKDPENCKITHEQVSMDYKTPHLKKIEKTCKGENFFGAQFCVEGQVPDLPTLRLDQVPALPTISFNNWHLTMAPAQDKPAALHWKHVVEINDEKEVRVRGQIDASSKTVARQIPYTITYTKANQQMVIQMQGVKAPGCQDCMLKCTVNRQEMKLQFGRGTLQYQVSATGQVQDQGKTLRLQVDWTEVPKEWRTFFYDWEPQIWYFLQLYAWVRRSEQNAKQVVIEFALTSSMTADMRVKTPNAMAKRTDLALPLRIERFPSSLQEIRNSLYAQCAVQDQTVKVFDNLQYQHNIKGGGCPYVLVQDHRKGKKCRIQLTMMIDKQGQKTVAAKIQQLPQQSVVIRPDKTILINGHHVDCSQKACRTVRGGATVAKVKKSDGKPQIQLSTQFGLHATIDDQRIQVFASPLLRSRVRGLCGDADGEQWNEYRDPQDRVQELSKFIQSWQEKC